MATFSYLGLNAQGKEVQGQLPAADLNEARTLLRGQGLRILDLVQGDLERQSLRDALRSLGRAFMVILPVRNSDMMLFYRQMQLMLRAGHTILEALDAAGRLSARPRLAMQLARCSERIGAGSGFSASLAQEKSTFPRIAVKLAEAGEASGELDAVFEQLAILTERRADIKRQLMTALTYPSIVLLMSIAVIGFLATNVIPRLAVFLESRGRAVPWAAQTMLDVAAWIQQWGDLVVLAFAALVVGLIVLRRVPPVRLLMDRFFLAVPVLGSTLMAAAMAQATWTFGLLLKSRLTVLESLRSVTQVIGNQAISGALEHAAEQVLEGRALAVALDRAPIPPLVRHMAAVGERSGEMERVMETLGNHYQKELDARVKFLSSMIEPMLTLFIGGIVGFVYYAFFQAVLAVSSGG
ncbi:MAG TPA: type II secretion system F family protein [Pseudomonas sp.]|nr:type II secretion system F family protein [Pseudomonas sp.]